MTDDRRADLGAAPATDPLEGYELVRRRAILDDGADVRFSLSPGDRPLVAAGETVVAGAPIAERLRDPQLIEASVPEAAEPRPGGRVAEGELLFAWRDRWRIATGSLREPVETPVAGIVREVRPGAAITVRTGGRAIRGIVALGGPTRGRLQVAMGKDGELRSGGLDIGFSGTILVVGSRIDAETLTRARAMGVRGIVVGGLASKERRDFLASEARQRAALHRLPPFAVLVLDGAVRRALPSPVEATLLGLIGRDVGIVTDPPMLVFDATEVPPEAVPRGLVRIRAGDHAGHEGSWAGLLGLRRFAGGVHLEAAAVRLSPGVTVAVPLGDLERFD